MGGLLTHLITALIGFLIIINLFKKEKWKYFFGIAFSLGHLIPDLIDFGIVGVLNRTLNPAEIIQIPLYDVLRWVGHTPLHWIIFGLFIFGICFLLYKFKRISKNIFIKLIILLACFISGVAIHLIIDELIIEKSYWI
jgi:hypothetical protein